MENKILDKNYWSTRWTEGSTGWDIGNIATPFISFFETLSQNNLRILIPGCGNGYEAEFLWNLGFTKVNVLDFAEIPLQNFLKRAPDFPADQLICSDFFKHKGEYDLIIEQTFFCAIDPKLRSQYVLKMHELLAPEGRIVGLLFNFPLTEEGPPFGGSKEEYVALFSEKFEISRMVDAPDSIKPRLGREFWIDLKRK